MGRQIPQMFPNWKTNMTIYFVDLTIKVPWYWRRINILRKLNLVKCVSPRRKFEKLGEAKYFWRLFEVCLIQRSNTLFTWLILRHVLWLNSLNTQAFDYLTVVFDRQELGSRKLVYLINLVRERVSKLIMSQPGCAISMYSLDCLMYCLKRMNILRRKLREKLN